MTFFLVAFDENFSKSLYYFLNSPPQNPDDHFLVVSPNFNPSFLNFFQDAPLILDARGRQLFLLPFMHLPLLFTFTYTFKKNLPHWMPPAWMPGAVALSSARQCG